MFQSIKREEMIRMWFIALVATVVCAAAPDLERARKLYDRTDYDGAVRALQALPEQTAETHELAGKSYYMMSDFKKASESFEKAFTADPASSTYAHWIGKAFGRRAETSSPFTAPGYASKTRQYFEKAVQLDPKNIEAMNDLFEYYLQAPGFLGGGVDKAAALAVRIEKADPIEGHYALARLAEHRKEYSTAEAQLRRSVEMAPKQIGRIVDLAKFLAKQGRHQEADQTFQQAERIDPDNPRLLFERAETYVRSHRNLETARTLLKKYLNTPRTPDLPSRADAEKLLKEAGG